MQTLRQQAPDDVVDGLRIRLALGGFHHLTNKEFEDTFVAGPEFRHVVGVFLDHFASRSFNRIVADLCTKPFGGDDLRGGAARIEHLGEDFLADGGSNLSGIDQNYDLAESLRRNGARGDFLAGIVEAAKKFGLHPVGGGFAGCPGLHHRFEIVRKGPGIGQNFRVVRRNSIGRNEANAKPRRATPSQRAWVEDPAPGNSDSRAPFPSNAWNRCDSRPDSKDAFPARCARRNRRCRCGARFRIRGPWRDSGTNLDSSLPPWCRTLSSRASVRLRWRRSATSLLPCCSR